MAYPSTRISVMDHAIPCNPCIFLSIHRKPPLYREITWPNTVTHHSNITKWRRNTTSELQTPVTTLLQFPHTKSPFTTDNEESPTSSSSPRQLTSTYCTQQSRGTSRFHSLAGCCTSCAVRIKSGELRQPEALGISTELKSKGYALLCVGYTSSDLEVETQDEDEVYWLQFGRYFVRGPIERDDYALELAMGDE